MHFGTVPIRIGLAVTLVAALFPAAGRADEGTDFFEKKIRPIFVQHCYACHSAEAKKSKGGLELDTPAGRGKRPCGKGQG